MTSRSRKTAKSSKFDEFYSTPFEMNRLLYESEEEDSKTTSDSSKRKSSEDDEEEKEINQAMPKTGNSNKTDDEDLEIEEIPKKDVYQGDTIGSDEQFDSFRPGEQGRDSRLTYSYKVIGGDGKTNFSVPKYLKHEKEKNSEESASDIFKKYGMKRARKYLTKAGYKTLTKKGAKIAGKSVAKKAATKGLAKAGTKLGAKSLSKKLPFGLGVLPALWYAGERAFDGDLAGAGLELASGATAAIPYVGTAGSVGIDTYLLNRDLKRGTGKGLADYAAKGITKAASKYVSKKIKGESTIKVETLYDRAKYVFESMFGIDESVGGYCFDDYVTECDAENRNFANRELNESGVYFGYGLLLCESTSEEKELDKLFKVISPDGKVSIGDLEDKPGDTAEIREAKRKIKEILAGGKSGRPQKPVDYYNLNKKDYKKALDSGTDSSGNLTMGQKFHKGADQIGDAVTRTLSRHGVPSFITKKLNIPTNMFRLAGTALGGMLFGPLGAVGGAALTNMLANSHQNYKAKQYARLHGMDDETAKGERSGYVGKLVGAGLGSAFGPAGAMVGAGLGHLLDRKMSPSIKNRK